MRHYFNYLMFNFSHLMQQNQFICDDLDFKLNVIQTLPLDAIFKQASKYSNELTEEEHIQLKRLSVVFDEPIMRNYMFELHDKLSHKTQNPTNIRAVVCNNLNALHSVLYTILTCPKYRYNLNYLGVEGVDDSMHKFHFERLMIRVLQTLTLNDLELRPIESINTNNVDFVEVTLMFKRCQSLCNLLINNSKECELIDDDLEFFLDVVKTQVNQIFKYRNEQFNNAHRHLRADLISYIKNVQGEEFRKKYSSEIYELYHRYDVLSSKELVELLGDNCATRYIEFKYAYRQYLS